MIKTSQFNPNMHLIYTIIIIHQLSWDSMLPYWRLHTKSTQIPARNSNHTDHPHTHTTRLGCTCTHPNTTASRTVASPRTTTRHHHLHAPVCTPLPPRHNAPPRTPHEQPTRSNPHEQTTRTSPENNPN